MAAWARSGKMKAGCVHTIKKRLGFGKRKGRSTILVEQKIGYGRWPVMKKVGPGLESVRAGRTHTRKEDGILLDLQNKGR
jgi:hypothetical protein